VTATLPSVGRWQAVLSSAADRVLADSAWTRHLRLLALAWIALLLLFRQDVAEMVAIWWNSSTFNHCLIIVPILVWLVVQRKEQLAALTPTSYWPALLYVAAAGFGWLLGDAAGVSLLRHAGLIMMLQGSVAAILGFNVLRGLLFPLFYMAFLVPFGEELVPILQTVTAKMCMVLLGWTGIPAQIDGIFITTPGGYFRVAEACAGVMFLIAMVAYGALVANLCFTRWSRRIVFMAVCVIVPIIANGIRAFGTIYIAEHVGVGFAEGFDHVFYGWIFFAIVIAIVMALGWRFFDKKADAIAFDPADLQAAARHRIGLIAASGLVLLLAATPVLWSSAIGAKPSAIPAQITPPEVKGWQAVAYNPGTMWRPHFGGATLQRMARYRNGAGQTVDMAIIVYDRQAEGRELVGYGNGAVDPVNKWVWVTDMAAPPNGKAERIKTRGPISRDVVSFYRVAGTTSGSAMQIKLATLRARLLGGNQQAVAILASAEHQNAISQRPLIDNFLSGLGDIDKMADQLAGVR
jgi:exosortase A